MQSEHTNKYHIKLHTACKILRWLRDVEITGSLLLKDHPVTSVGKELNNPSICSTACMTYPPKGIWRGLSASSGVFSTSSLKQLLGRPMINCKKQQQAEICMSLLKSSSDVCWKGPVVLPSRYIMQRSKGTLALKLADITENWPSWDPPPRQLKQILPTSYNSLE